MKIIKTEQEYELALKRLEKIFDAKQGTEEGDELELLALLIGKYENEHFPIPNPDPIDAIKFRMEQMNYKQKDVAKILGYKGRVSEILSRKRKLTLDMVKKLHEKMNIPLSVLIGTLGEEHPMIAAEPKVPYEKMKKKK